MDGLGMGESPNLGANVLLFPAGLGVLRLSTPGGGVDLNPRPIGAKVAVRVHGGLWTARTAKALEIAGCSGHLPLPQPALSIQTGFLRPGHLQRPLGK